MLTDAEAIALEIMRTDDLMAIGAQEDVMKSLVAKGYARKLTGVWHRITPAGLEAFEVFENAQMRAVIREQRRPSDYDGGVTIEGEVEC